MKNMQRYTCPWLMWVQYLLMRCWPFGPAVRLRNGAVEHVMPKGHGVEVRAWWPDKLILAECAFHNWRQRAYGRLVMAYRGETHG